LALILLLGAARPDVSRILILKANVVEWSTGELAIEKPLPHKKPVARKVSANTGTLAAQRPTQDSAVYERSGGVVKSRSGHGGGYGMETVRPHHTHVVLGYPDHWQQ
jgi:hypothetical protein